MRGRFHYLPLETVRAKLRACSFGDVEHRVSYAGQAYLLLLRRGESGDARCLIIAAVAAAAG